MNTEITDKDKVEGWVLYDADCHFCIKLARRFQDELARRRLQPLPLQTPWVRAKLGLTNMELLAEMRLLKPNGKIFGGADALLEISRFYRLPWPIHQLAKIPVVTKIFRLGYRWIARNRNRVSDVCKIEKLAFHKPIESIKSSTRDTKNVERRPGKRIVFFEMP